MQLIKDLMERPAVLPATSRYAIMNGVIYTVLGLVLIAWPHALQVLLRERDFVGGEQGLMRVIGLTVLVIGWLYLFGGRTGGRQFTAASVVDRLIFVPAVTLPVACFGVFPRLLIAFTIMDMSLAVGAWVLLSRAKPD
jgi:hypothetical protein